MFPPCHPLSQITLTLRANSPLWTLVSSYCTAKNAPLVPAHTGGAPRFARWPSLSVRYLSWRLRLISLGMEVVIGIPVLSTHIHLGSFDIAWRMSLTLIVVCSEFSSLSHSPAAVASAMWFPHICLVHCALSGTVLSGWPGIQFLSMCYVLIVPSWRRIRFSFLLSGLSRLRCVRSFCTL